VRNSDWGDVHDERRVESYERPQANDEYEIVVSKAKNDPKRGRDSSATEAP
jgi:hypothetical protein